VLAHIDVVGIKNVVGHKNFLFRFLGVLVLDLTLFCKKNWGLVFSGVPRVRSRGPGPGPHYKVCLK